MMYSRGRDRNHNAEVGRPAQFHHRYPAIDRGDFAQGVEAAVGWSSSTRTISKVSFVLSPL
jgi:hypothetical protein